MVIPLNEGLHCTSKLQTQTAVVIFCLFTSLFLFIHLERPIHLHDYNCVTLLSLSYNPCKPVKLRCTATHMHQASDPRRKNTILCDALIHTYHARKDGFC
ncbi:hypothetical protein QL285_057078 [Trifolium repens]|nr:hypothetical protein QL285_057078 [Trifolium repens]